MIFSISASGEPAQQDTVRLPVYLGGRNMNGRTTCENGSKPRLRPGMSPGYARSVSLSGSVTTPHPTHSPLVAFSVWQTCLSHSVLPTAVLLVSSNGCRSVLPQLPRIFHERGHVVMGKTWRSGPAATPSLFGLLSCQLRRHPLILAITTSSWSILRLPAYNRYRGRRCNYRGMPVPSIVRCILYAISLPRAVNFIA